MPNVPRLDQMADNQYPVVKLAHLKYIHVSFSYHFISALLCKLEIPEVADMDAMSFDCQEGDPLSSVLENIANVFQAQQVFRHISRIIMRQALLPGGGVNLEIHSGAPNACKCRFSVFNIPWSSVQDLAQSLFAHSTWKDTLHLEVEITVEDLPSVNEWGKILDTLPKLRRITIRSKGEGIDGLLDSLASPTDPLQPGEIRYKWLEEVQFTLLNLRSNPRCTWRHECRACQSGQEETFRKSLQCTCAHPISNPPMHAYGSSSVWMNRIRNWLLVRKGNGAAPIKLTIEQPVCPDRCQELGSQDCLLLSRDVRELIVNGATISV